VAEIRRFSAAIGEVRCTECDRASKDIVEQLAYARPRPVVCSGPAFLPKMQRFVRRLKAAGAVFLGKLNLQEFAYGGSSVISYIWSGSQSWDPIYSAEARLGDLRLPLRRGFVMPQLAPIRRFYTAAGELLRHCWI